MKDKFKKGDKVLIHCRGTRDKIIKNIYDGKTGTVEDVLMLSRNPWGNIAVVIEGRLHNSFFEDELTKTEMNYIEKVKALLDDNSLSSEKKEKLKQIFPELKENEDEKIRKEIISFVTDTKNWFPKEETKASWIAWLEKQGEQKSTDKDMIDSLRTEYENGKADAIAEMKKTAEWSEEDKIHIGRITDVLRMIASRRNRDEEYWLWKKREEFYEGEILWLKSLKERLQIEKYERSRT